MELTNASSNINSTLGNSSVSLPNASDAANAANTAATAATAATANTPATKPKRCSKTREKCLSATTRLKEADCGSRSARESDSDNYTSTNTNTDSEAVTQATSAQLENSHTVGRNIRLAMACMHGADRLAKLKAEKRDLIRPLTGMPETPKPDSYKPASDKPEPHLGTDPLLKPKHTVRFLSDELHKKSFEIEAHRAELLELLVQFDEQQGWVGAGARNCCDWADANLGIAKATAYEFLSTGRSLRHLPMIRALFRSGELSWSKVRLLAKVATADTERDLAHVSLDATVADVRRVCTEFRWDIEEAERADRLSGRTSDDEVAEQQFNNRRLSWQEQSDGSILIKIHLPPEKAAAVLKSLEHCENELNEELNDTDKNEQNDKQLPPPSPKLSPSQRKADALCLMAERSLQHSGPTVSRADRYQVIMHVQNSDFTRVAGAGSLPNRFPPKKPWIEGLGPMADSVAKRITCDCSVVSLLCDDGEPLSVGRKTRVWPSGIRRAIEARDRHCQFPGCSEHRHLDVHHIQHWSEGGDTSVENGICLCHQHHSLVHEGGYRIERNTIATNQEPGKGFGLTVGLVSRSKKALLPTRHRFRFVAPTTLGTENNLSITNTC